MATSQPNITALDNTPKKQYNTHMKQKQQYQIMRETTMWEDGTMDTGRHVYVFTDYKPNARAATVVAFSGFGRHPVKKYTKPLTIDLRGRTFEEVV